MHSPFSLRWALSVGVIPVAVLIAVTLSGCSGNREGDETADIATAAPSPSPSPPPAQESRIESTNPAPTSAPASDTPIIIEFNGQQITGQLDSGAASASFITQLPLTLSFRDHGGQEKIADLPAPLDLDGAPERSAAAALTIGYYAPSQGLVLYYEDVGSFPGIVPLGTMEESTSLELQTNDFTATIREAS